MRISYNWLKEYVDVKASAEELAHTLTMSGLSVESMERIGHDHIFEIEITSNRPDCLSFIGVAREVAAITGSKLKVPAIAKLHEPKTKGEVKIKVEDKALCPRYTGRIIKDVKVKESAAWLKEKLEAMGNRPVNNIVDITNFCLFETGEPMHAFDLDKIAGREVIIRKAKKGEKIVTIDGLERTLDDTMLIIADSQKPIAIAGVMGGLNTEVTASTKNILLEAAYFDPLSVRRTSRKLGLSSESSYRFERRVDIENILYSSDRATSLILEMAGGTAGEIIDIGEKVKAGKEIELRCSKVNSVLGIDLEGAKVKAILHALGLEAKESSKDKLAAKTPSFRYDLQNEIDLIEEVSRIYGYNNIPQTIPAIVEQPLRRPSNMIATQKIREILTGFGADEIMTYSLLSRKLLSAGRFNDASVVEVRNPLSNEQEVMRPTLAVGMLNTILWNINRKTKDLRLFELGNVYYKDGKDASGGGFAEGPSLCVALTGQVSSGWLGGWRDANFFDLKGMAESLLSELGVENFSIKEAKDEFFSPAASASLEIGSDQIGMLGEVDGAILESFDIKARVYLLEICVETLLKYVRMEKTFRQLARYPSVVRDISLIVDTALSNAHISSVITHAGGSLLKDAALIDRYVGKQIPQGKASLTYRLEYQDPTKTLEEKDITAVHSRILASLEQKCGAKLRETQ